MNKLQKLIERLQNWPEEAQEQAVTSLKAIEQEYLNQEQLSTDDVEALQRSAEDVRRGRFASDEEMRELFHRFRTP